MAKETVNHETPEDLDARRKLAFSANFEILKLAEAASRICDNDDHAIFHGMMARIQQLAEIVYFAQRLHGDDPAEVGEPELKNLQRCFDGALLA